MLSVLGLKGHLSRLAGDKRIRFLVIGGINTVNGYLISLICYYTLAPHLNIVFISVIINIISITFSFTTNKLFVFRTKGNWLAEYLRCYVVYGGVIFISLVATWLTVEVMLIQFWIAQLIIIPILILISYIGHSRFSFIPRKR